MTTFARNTYKEAINKNEIYLWTINSNAIKKIQDIKESIISKINWVISTKIDSKEYTNQELSYIEALEEESWISVQDKNELIKTKKQELEAMSKRQTSDYFIWESLKEYEKQSWSELVKKFKNIPYRQAEKEEWFNSYWSFKKLERKINLKKSYISNFSKFSEASIKYSWLIKAYSIESSMNNDEKNTIGEYFDIISKNTDIKKTRSKELWFDLESFNSSEEKNNKNIKCFYETDFAWNKRFFSINELLNDLESFWIECWLPTINPDLIPDDIKNKYFPSINRKIRKSIYTKIVSEMRDKQEVLLYWFKDYELESWEKNDQKEWFLAEKVVEWVFRNMANYSQYNIKVRKASIWEDQQNKIDLIVSLEDKETWVNIEKQLQLTLKEDTSIKEKQIEKRKIELQNSNIKFTDIELVKLTLQDLWKKVKIWQYFNRPIWWIKEMLSWNELELLQWTFDKIASDLEAKKTR